MTFLLQSPIRRLFIVFTIRRRRIRIISARDMSPKERRMYRDQTQKRPTFKSEKQEAEFWASHDSTEYVDYSKSRRMVFPRLKPSTKTISLRLPKSLLDQLKTIANKRDVPYQTLLKLFVLERVQAELHHKPAKAS